MLKRRKSDKCNKKKFMKGTVINIHEENHYKKYLNKKKFNINRKDDT